MTKVLLFESDAEFAQSLQNGLQRYGCETTVVEDGEEGIAWAGGNKPDLILLTIELPRMNGFSVCNKLKRNGDLKSVPLVLLSSDATQETFEQHKRLRTRADEYVHKPVTLEELVEKLKGIVELTPTGSDEVDEVDEVTIEDPSTLEAVSELTSVDEETEEAFGNLIAADEPAMAAEEIEMDDLVLDDDDGLEVAPADPAPPPQPSRPSHRPPPPSHRPSAPSSGPPPLPEGPPPSQGRMGPDPEMLARNEALTQEVTQLKEQIASLETELKSAQDAAGAEADAKAQVAQKKDAEIELVQREVEELRAKLQSNESGGGSAREFLDLREQLNKRDKEIIDIRDVLTGREKELVRINDDNIALGREKADLMDRVGSLEAKTSELEKSCASLSNDKEQAIKRGDDFKSKSERLQGELDTKLEELRVALESHENVMATRDAHEAAMRDDHANALRAAAVEAEEVKQAAVAEAIAATEEKAAGEKEQALVAAAEEAAEAKAAAIAAREAEMRAEQDSKLAALHRANEESLRKLRAEHEQQSEEAENAAAERLRLREEELAGEKQEALDAQKAESDARYQDLENEKRASEEQRDGRIAQLEGELATRTGERDQHAQTIAERDRKIEELEAALAGFRASEVELKDELRHKTELLDGARAKWSEDSASIRGAQEALSAVLEELQQAQERPMP